MMTIKKDRHNFAADVKIYIFSRRVKFDSDSNTELILQRLEIRTIIYEHRHRLFRLAHTWSRSALSPSESLTSFHSLKFKDIIFVAKTVFQKVYKLNARLTK